VQFGGSAAIAANFACEFVGGLGLGWRIYFYRTFVPWIVGLQDAGHAAPFHRDAHRYRDPLDKRQSQLVRGDQFLEEGPASSDNVQRVKSLLDFHPSAVQVLIHSLRVVSWLQVLGI